MKVDIEAETPPGLLAGRLEGIGLPELVWSLCRRGKTGMVVCVRGHVERTLHVREGQIIFAGSSDPSDRLGELLLRKGTVSLEQLEKGVFALNSGKRIGALLVEHGALTADELVDAVIAQIEWIVLDTLTWNEGEYRFNEGPLPTDEVITLSMKTSELLLRGIRGFQSYSRIRGRVGSPQTIYALTENWAEIVDELNLTEGEHSMIEWLSAEGVTVERLCREVALSNFEVYQAIGAYRVLGLVEPLGWRRESADPAARSGHLELGGFAELLIESASNDAVGVLHIARGTVERTFHITEGRCSFATSSDPDDNLVNFLLRRGVISMRDREEVVKRLLSNKRVGTILREIGVLDDDDLQHMVREHLSEIVLDTFRWNDGTWFFVPGSLPTLESITLERSVASLVAEGIRRVESWTRVIIGCGGIDQPLGLSPVYLDLLDAMGAGVDEWAVVNALKSPQSPRRACRLVDLADYRVCQILWTLKLLGAVEAVTVDVDEEILEGLPEPDATSEGETVVAAVAAEAVEHAGSDEPEAVLLIDDVTIDETSGPEEEIPVTQSSAETPVDAPQAVEATPRETPELPVAPEEILVLDATPPVPEGDHEAESIDSEVEIPLDVAPPEVQESELPADAEMAIERFNAMHQVVYKAVRSEIGAGAQNFVHSCSSGPDADETGILEGVSLGSDGIWDLNGLRRAIREHSVSNPWPVYQEVLDRLFISLEPHLSPSRAENLRRKILDLDA